MAGDFSIRAVNNWRAEMHASMSDALQVSRDVFHRNAAQSTKHMIILMAQSARAMTKQSKENRPIEHDQHGDFVTVYFQSGKTAKRYKWTFSKPGAKGTWEGAQWIRRRGLAKRSWMWGLSDIKGDVAGYEGPGAARIKGVSVGSEIRSRGEIVGHMIDNRLGYLEKILPSGWQAAVEQKAINKVMKQAEMKMVKEFERDIGRRQ
jgi:hypothetical protein